ncbi:hypothetical protein IFR04_009804 [Cadophora malorum]|uniref:Zn(2)-C6 fungal-type domain-containing protein n=1 Tax=Cadophora malorum TaxID=108018 RepID=A0A8H7W967_9HELO|nr:hypothetical protein IFR04_009804 [Cadophora malorum]
MEYSSDHLSPISPVLYTSISPAGTADSSFAGTPIKHEEGSFPEPPRKKQKRNKPTLSCEECVERKTKCDRGRPNCIACIKRQTECKYTTVANVLEETNRSVGNAATRMTKPPKKKSMMNGFEGPKQAPNPHQRSVSRGSTSSSTGLLSNVPYSNPTASNVFGIGSEHPFANYWTCQGGLPETISVLPEKIQADILLDRYFECVDPVYPMIHRQTFYADYEHFWSLPQPEKDRVDGTLVAMIFAMLAMGTQFVTTTGPKERQQTAEFYVSAAHQSLRMSSYLNKASVRSIQAMVLITYFLINDNHASDGWAFAGILIRQAYAMGLHRDPNIVCPNASIFDKQMRRKLWQAVLLQDTFLTVLLSLPPSATHTDVNVDDLIDDSSSIAHSNPTDTAYIRGCWTLANLVQETICSPRSLDLPISSTPRQKAKLLSDFKAVFRSFPDVFRSWDDGSITALAQTNKRIVRQTLFLTSNYFHNVMLVHSSGSPEVPVNVRGALEAAHDAINAFFLLFNIFASEAKVWWVFNHRAFLEALCIGNILREEESKGNGEDLINKDPLFARGKADILQMIQIMRIMSEGEDGSAVALTRVSVLSTYL